jgi:hypothetical protein
VFGFGADGIMVSGRGGSYAVKAGLKNGIGLAVVPKRFLGFILYKSIGVALFLFFFGAPGQTVFFINAHIR